MASSKLYTNFLPAPNEFFDSDLRFVYERILTRENLTSESSDFSAEFGSGQASISFFTNRARSKFEPSKKPRFAYVLVATNLISGAHVGLSEPGSVWVRTQFGATFEVGVKS